MERHRSFPPLTVVSNDKWTLQVSYKNPKGELKIKPGALLVTQVAKPLTVPSGPCAAPCAPAVPPASHFVSVCLYVCLFVCLNPSIIPSVHLQGGSPTRRVPA